MTWRPLLSTGSLGMVPPLQRYYETLRLPDTRLDPFEFLHEPIPSCRPWFAPLGCRFRSPIRIYDGNVGVSQVPWNPWWSLSVFFDPGRIRQAEWTMSELPDTAPACVHDEGSRRLVLTGLNHTTFDLAVYASQDGLPHHHARLASGCWSSFARRDSYPQGFSERFHITPARKFRMLLHINPTRQRGKRTGSLAGASGWYMTFFAVGVIVQVSSSFPKLT